MNWVSIKFALKGICGECNRLLMPITAPGAWGPPDLQNRFPDLEPWINLQIRNSSKVRVLLGSPRIVSVITKKSAQDLRLSKGNQMYAVIKVTNVIIA